MKLTFKEYSQLMEKGPSTWSPETLAQVKAICGLEDWEEYLEDYLNEPPADVDDLEERFEEWEMLWTERVIAVDEAGEVVCTLYFFDFGTAYCFKGLTTEEIGGACQHGFELNPPNATLQAAIGAAYAASSPKIDQSIQFS